jgi:LacI family transcriptional regulator
MSPLQAGGRVVVKHASPTLLPSRRVALAFPSRFAHLPGIVHGITDYARAHGRWRLTTGAELFGLPVADLRAWSGDGVIAALGTDADVAAARRLKVPVVTMFGMVRAPGVPRVMVDQAAIGRLAADHLVSRGYRRFAFYGLQGLAYSTDRERAFAARLTPRGVKVNRFLSPAAEAGRRIWEEVESLRRWIEALAHPVGVFAANDQRARMLANAVGLAGRRIPEDVGIIGVDNDEIACEFGEPTLTSIACNWAAVGFESARLLDELMSGHAPQVVDQLIAPTGVVSRESTDVTITDHPAVARAVTFARDHRGEPFGVEALVEAAGVSRRSLELAFARSLGCTPADFLVRLRAEQAKELLDEGGHTLVSVARTCGFRDVRQFARAFQRCMNMSPRQYKQGVASAAARAVP